MTKMFKRAFVFISVLLIVSLLWVHASIEGKIVKNKDSVYLYSKNGKRFLITGEASVCFKYAQCEIEILDPLFPTPDTLTFSRYRIKNSDDGHEFPSSVRTILSTAKLRPDFEFQVVQVGSKVRFVIYIRNSSLKPEILRFPSSQKYDFLLMNQDEKKVLWKWSWGKKFKIGFNTLIIPPSTELKFSEEWNFLSSYIEDGEYIAYAQIFCMPHGWLSKRKRVILHSETEKVQLAESFIPLNPGNRWIYVITPGNRKVSMEVTGFLRKYGKKYYVVSFFPDSRHIMQEGSAEKFDSTLIRFDREKVSFVKLEESGEVPLIISDSTHRVVPSDNFFVCSAGSFDHCLDYQYLSNHKWTTVYKIVPGIGIVKGEFSLPGEGKKTFALQDVFFNEQPIPSKNAAMESTTESRKEGNFYITFHKYGGVPPVDITYSIRSNGTCVILDDGKIAGQGILGASTLWDLVHYMESQGVFDLKSSYGDNDIDNPLIIELNVGVNNRKTHVRMKTSASDKPPMAFWKIVDKIVSTVNQIKQDEDEKK